VPALLSGEVDMVFSAYPSIAGFVKAGQVKLIATNAARRWPLEPNVPPIADKIPGFDFAPNVIILARAGAPSEAINRLSSEIGKIAKMPDAINALRTAGVALIGGSPADLAAVLAKEEAQMLAVAKQARLQPE
jgi:tripartite-type tricarboxylate transporter receptor subunit TctC